MANQKVVIEGGPTESGESFATWSRGPGAEFGLHSWPVGDKFAFTVGTGGYPDRIVRFQVWLSRAELATLRDVIAEHLATSEEWLPRVQAREAEAATAALTASGVA